MKNIKRTTTCTITGLHMTEQRQAQLGQALMLRCIQVLDGETDDVAITFTQEATTEELAEQWDDAVEKGQRQ